METTRHPPARRTAEPAPPATDADRRAQDRELKEQTDKEIAERLSTPPEQPTPTQEEADSYKEGEPAVPPESGAARAGETAAQRREREEKERHEREVKPDEAHRSGYQTR